MTGAEDQGLTGVDRSGFLLVRRVFGSSPEFFYVRPLWRQSVQTVPIMLRFLKMFCTTLPELIYIYPREVDNSGKF